MNLRESIVMYRDVRTSDGAGGFTTVREEIGPLFADIKPLSVNRMAYLGLEFNQIKGTQMYEVWIRTDFDRIIDTTYLFVWEGIYGNLTLMVNTVELHRNKTKLICTYENRITA